MNKWRTVRFGAGTYGVAKTSHGEIVYNGAPRRHEFTTIEQANEWAAKLNGDSPPMRRCQPGEFEDMTRHVRMYDKTRAALRSIIVDGWTWSRAAEQYDITESGILRAMRRVSNLNHA